MSAPHLWELVERAALVNASGEAIIFGDSRTTWRETRDPLAGLTGRGAFFRCLPTNLKTFAPVGRADWGQLKRG